MYKEWIIKKWDSIIYKKKIEFISLLDKRKLVITVRTLEPNPVTYEVEFVGQYAYRSYDESYREDLWVHIGNMNFKGAEGSTWIVENSDFLKSLMSDSTFRSHCEGAVHYVISTINDVVEVVALEHPVIRKLL